MSKKFIAPFEPAHLVQAADRWYICFYCTNDATGKRERFRPTFNLNRIEDLRTRKSVADELVQKLNWWMEQGKPITKFDAARVRLAEVNMELTLLATPFAQAMQELLAVLKQTMRPDTLRTYANIGLAFLDFLKRKKWGNLMCSELTRPHAAAYLDDCLTVRKLSPRTYNNQIGHLRTLCNKLVDRGYLQENPFSAQKMIKAQKKNRRNFTPDEARAVAQHIQREKPLLFLALLLEYACFLRPNEIRSLRFENINLATGIVHLHAAQAKDGEDRYTTIPSAFLPAFSPAFFGQYPGHWYIFGKGFAPHDSKRCGKSTMHHLHESYLKALKKMGTLQNIQGLTWYSWKDTGITDALNDLPLLAVKDQAGHSDPKMTMKYRHPEKVNPHMKKFQNRLI